MNKIQEFFSQNLDKVEAYVRSGGLVSHGSVGEKCQLVFENGYLNVFTRLEYNHVCVSELVRQKMYEVREKEKFNYATVGDLFDAVNVLIKNTYVQVASISPYEIKSINLSYADKQVLRDCEITYNDGSLVKIKAIEPIKTV